MATKDITDKQVCEATAQWKERRDRYGFDGTFAYEHLVEMTGQCEKVCFRALQRAIDRGYLEVGTSERTAWLTQEGKALLK